MIPILVAALWLVAVVAVVLFGMGADRNRSCERGLTDSISATTLSRP